MKKKTKERLMKAVAGITKGIKENKKAQQKAIAAAIAKAVADSKEAFSNEVNEDALKEMIVKFRKGEFAGISNHGREMHPMVIEKSDDPKIKEFQEWQDSVYLISKIMNISPRQVKLWGKQSGNVSELKKAMDASTSGEGSEWVPTELSAQLQDLVRLEAKVANLFGRVNMPTNPFEVPVVSSDATAKKVSESTADGATNFPESTPGTRKMTFTAVKMAARVLMSEELNEDSIVAMITFIKQNLATAMAYGLEDALINGDTSATHQDSDVTAATDVRKLFNGLRKLTQSGNKVDLSTFSTTAVRNLRVKLGKYGTNPKDCAIITGPIGFMQLANLTEVRTVDKYGAQATILNGELGRIDGMPIIVSEKMRENLNASGVYDGTTTSKTALIMVNRPTFWIGDRRKLTVKTWEDIQTDQTILVSTSRHDFQNKFDTTSENVVAYGYNIANTLS
jgi:HK97 family phage major capsid protein